MWEFAKESLDRGNCHDSYLLKLSISSHRLRRGHGHGVRRLRATIDAEHQTQGQHLSGWARTQARDGRRPLPRPRKRPRTCASRAAAGDWRPVAPTTATEAALRLRLACDRGRLQGPAPIAAATTARLAGCGARETVSQASAGTGAWRTRRQAPPASSL